MGKQTRRGASMPRGMATRDSDGPSSATAASSACDAGDTVSCASSGVCLSESVRKWVEECATLWWESETGSPYLGPSLTPDEQAQREAQLDQLQSMLASEARRVPRTGAARQSAKRHLQSAFGALAGAILGREGDHTRLLLEQGLADIGSQFAQMARRFDPDVRGSDIFQALRNVWTMNGLQLLMGLPPELTPAIFAYSMLYPYTDNYLDHPAISPEAKRAFNERFGQRLSGEDISPADSRERIIFDLVNMIETQFERARHPEVFESLHAIHHAQRKSVRLLNGVASPYEVDVLGISLEKGGASVLADGYLVAGSLAEDQAASVFGWGAFVQLVDDLQDVEEDMEGGLSTVFSQTAKHWALDAVTDRALHFGARVVARLGCFDAPTARPIKELMRRSVPLLLIDAAGTADQFYTEAYLRRLEPHSPFRFSFLRERRAQAVARRASLVGLIEAFASLEDSASPTPFPLT